MTLKNFVKKQPFILAKLVFSIHGKQTCYWNRRAVLSEQRIRKKWPCGYKEHLGIDPGPDRGRPRAVDAGSRDNRFLAVAGGYWSHFTGMLEKQWMINFRVRDLGTLVDELRASKIEVTFDPEMTPYGRFARLYDPEGNPIELWEPE